MTANYDDAVVSPEMPTVNVRVIEDANKAKDRPKEIRSSHRTIVLTLANPWVQLVGYDPARISLFMNIMDNPVVLSGSISEASDPANLTGALVAPNGRLMPVGNDYVVRAHDEQFVSAATYPTRVSFTIIRQV
jgi:hypothetical protein